jgi:hypothetical protein
MSQKKFNAFCSASLEIIIIKVSNKQISDEMSTQYAGMCIFSQVYILTRFALRVIKYLIKEILHPIKAAG